MMDQRYIGAPNGVVLCIEEKEKGALRGRLYSKYGERDFASTLQMVSRMEELFDALRFPFPGSNERLFVEREKTVTEIGEITMSDESLLSKHGDMGTFIVRVQHRQNSSWQGRITWMEENKTVQFRSVWEMIKLIENAVDSVSESEEEASWE